MNNELLDDFNYQKEEKKDIVYASFGRRALAIIIDNIIVYAAIIPLHILLGFLNPTENALEFYLNIISFFLSILYFPLFEGGENQATPGKQIMKIKVVNESGGQISYGQAFGRYFAKILSTIIFFMGYIMVAFTKKKQGLHDAMASTYVINSK